MTSPKKFGPPNDRTGERNPFKGRKHTPEWIEAHRKRFTKWTEAELLQLRVWYEARAGKELRLAELCTILGRTKATISGKAGELGLSDKNRRPVTHETGKRRPNAKRPSEAKYATEEERRAAVGRATRERFARQGHPRGMLGKKHSPEHCKRQSETRRGKQLNLSPEARQALSDRATRLAATKPITNAYSRCNWGRRDDLGGQFFRSRWEANYARVLEWKKAQGLIKGWEYEAETFWFEKIKRGVRSYKPDFKITRLDDSTFFVEVKGWMDAKSKTKLARMKRYHPNIDLHLVGENEYKQLARDVAPVIPNWEYDNRKRA